MGFSGISLAQLAVLLIIVLAIFGTKKLRNMGEDLGKAVKNFREAMNDSEIKPSQESKVLPENQNPKE